MMREVYPKYRNNIRGIAAVEFAIIAPVFMLILFGIIAYGVFFGAANSVQQLAANSARAAMGGLDVEERQALVDSYVDRYLSKDGILVEDHLTVVVEPDENDGTLLSVRVAYNARELPVWNLYSGLPLPQKIIERNALIRTGGS